MRETPEELKELQALLDDSLSRSTTHLRSIINTERTLTAEQLTQVITGMCTLALSTVSPPFSTPDRGVPRSPAASLVPSAPLGTSSALP